jgi:Leucine-rich repeat (LRR) protein
MEKGQLAEKQFERRNHMTFAYSGFFLLLLPLSIGLQENGKEKALVQKIENLGGCVTRDDEGKLLGVHLGNFWQGFTALYTRESQVRVELTDELLQALDLSPFSHVSLISRVLTDRGLAHLEKIPKLESFTLFSSKITDKGLSKLIKKHRSLSSLWLFYTPLSDNCMSAIAELPDLECLCLLGNNVSDKGLKRLEGLTNLKLLCLSGTRISDAGLHHLTKMKNLSHLGLDSTAISDAAILPLSNLKSLRSLSIRSTKITPKAEQALRQALPELEIHK